MTHSDHNKRIAKNTLMLYFRLILTMAVSLFTSRVILNTLGIEDFGIRNVVDGVVVMFSFLSGTMATATQRFFSYELGRRDIGKLKQIFSQSYLIYFLIACLVVVLAETIGLWFVSHKLVIPADRMNAALWVYHFAVASFFLSIMVSLYIALVIAHEDMGFFAYVSIMDVALKLLVVYLLVLFPVDKLKLLGMLTFGVGVITLLVYYIYCRRKYAYCRFQFSWNKQLLAELGQFAGWNLFGTLAWLGRSQGINIVLNMFFGPAVNAAQSIAIQVNAAVSSFSQNFTSAVNPPIIKSYAGNDMPYVWSLVFRSSKFSFLLLWGLSLPILFEADTILALWLKTVPGYTPVFVRLVLMDALLTSFTFPLAALNQATGNIKLYQAGVGLLLLLNLPIAIYLFKAGYPPPSCLVTGVVISFIALFLRMAILHRQVRFPVSAYCKGVLLRAVVVAVLSVIPPAYIVFWMPPGPGRLLLTALTCVVTFVLVAYVAGLNRPEREFLRGKVGRMLARVVS